VKAKADQRAALAAVQASMPYLLRWTDSLVDRHGRDMNDWAR
jgi:hypothetical protein